jgi:lipopolysaccharide transport system ATP-binding protein
MRPIVKVANVAKRYRIGKREQYRTLRDALAEGLIAPLRGLAGLFRTHKAETVVREHTWALDDVSFEVMPGEVMGIIGRNGAGKSTLLKILSRITEPTRGRFELYGRLGSLLEVGTGFHQELTGRENIFLSGAILGMRRGEIVRKFDEIVAFAEVDRFIDSPVKHYSSGMYVRLAFAVAAHLEPEILLIDEVLAVGDASFQRRCLGKIGDVARNGRTVLFVSHNMASIEALCDSCLCIRSGQTEGKGDTAGMIARYLADDFGTDGGSCAFVNHPGRRRDAAPLMSSVELVTDGGRSGAVGMGSRLSVKVNFICESQPLSPVLIVTIKSANHTPIFAVSNKYNREFLFPDRVAGGTIVCTLERLPLMPGRYYLDLSFGNEVIYDLDEIHEAISLDVTPADVFGSGKLPPAASGPVFWPAQFELVPV